MKNKCNNNLENGDSASQNPSADRNNLVSRADLCDADRRILLIIGEATARTLIQGHSKIQWDPQEIEELDRLGS